MPNNEDNDPNESEEASWRTDPSASWNDPDSTMNLRKPIPHSCRNFGGGQKPSREEYSKSVEQEIEEMLRSWIKEDSKKLLDLSEPGELGRFQMQIKSIRAALQRQKASKA